MATHNPIPQDDTIVFLGWYDPNKKKSQPDKFLEALARHKTKHGTFPNTALVSPQDYEDLQDMVLPEGFRLLARSNIAPNTFLVGYDDKRKKGPDIVIARS